MDSTLNKPFFCNFKEIIVEEIALHGLEGIGIVQLWKHVEYRLSTTLTEKIQARFWSFLSSLKCVSFFELPEPYPTSEVIDRFALVDENSGMLKEHDTYLDGPYEYCPIENEYGSCSSYNLRKPIHTEIIQKLSYEDIMKTYGDKMVIVATLEERWRALAPHLPITYLSHLTTIQYCMLELVGKARENGQLTVGTTNLTKIIKDSKLLFYYRKTLHDLGLIKMQYVHVNINSKVFKAIILRLARFHRCKLLTIPKSGMIYNLIQYLKNRPGYSEQTEIVIKKGLLTQKHSKKLQKYQNLFHFNEKEVTLVIDSAKTKNQKITVKKKFICLNNKSDESSQSEDENSEQPLKSQYKVGVDIIRQGYELFLEAGLEGLTQIQLAQLLNVESCTGRMIVKNFMKRHLLREFLVDSGRQRVAKYIAVAATKEVNQAYLNEKKKFMEYLESTKTSINESSDEDSKLADIKVKIEPESKTSNQDQMEDNITEIKQIQGVDSINNWSLLTAKKNPTLRQLKMANAIIKVIREKLVISGFQSLSQIAAKECNEPPLDTKALKIFIQKLVVDKQIKILKLKWPGTRQGVSFLLCAPHIKCNDPLIRAKYKEITVRTINNRKRELMKQNARKITGPLSNYAYPKYMKVQKMHEFLMNLIYFNPVKMETELPEGFTTLYDILPEITLEYAVGSMSNGEALNLEIFPNINTTLLSYKLRELPDKNLFKKLASNSSLHSSLKENLKVLAMFGLIQLIINPSKKVDQNRASFTYMIYINRNAKIIDTRDKWPREYVDIPSLTRHYQFKTFADVQEYWKDIFNISMNTSIDYAMRSRKRIAPPMRWQDDVLTNDNAEVFGDGFGPCGFDSGFFMERRRFWTLYQSRNAYKTKPRPVVKVAATERKKRVKKKVIKKPPPKPIARMTEHKVVLRNRYEVEPKWEKWEDYIIMFCKAAITILSPKSQPCCLTIRNAAAKDLLSIQDPHKTIRACHNRTKFLQSNKTLTYAQECIINEMRRRKNLITIYEELLRKIRLRNSKNINNYILEGRIKMLELVWIMLEVVQSKSYKEQRPCVALNLEEFHKNFRITEATSNKEYNTYKTPTDTDHKIATLKEAVLWTIMLHFNSYLKKDSVTSIFKFISSNSEETIREALEQIRKSGAIASNEKYMVLHSQSFITEQVLQSAFKMSALYQRQWHCKLNESFIDNLGDSLEKEYSQTNLKGNEHVNCLFSELMACDFLNTVTVVVPTITGPSDSLNDESIKASTINKFQLSSGVMGWQSKCNVRKFTELYKCMNVKEKFDNLLSITSTQDCSEQNDEDEIVTILEARNEKGCTLDELQVLSGLTRKVLVEKLLELENKKVIARVGYYENKLIHVKFVHEWKIPLESNLIIPTPWLNFNCTLRYDVLFQWSGAVLNKITDYPGSSISQLSDHFKFLTNRAVQDICMFLQNCECLVLKILNVSEPDLFSNLDETLELEEFNSYEAPENILAFPVKDSLVKYAFVRKSVIHNYSKVE